jgi:hypothetical protein
MGGSGENLKTIITNFFGAFDEKAAAMMGGLIAIGVIMAKFNVPKFAFMTAMTALGFGIAGFFTGIMVGDFLVSKIDAAGLDGKTLGKLMKNFFGAFKGATGITVLMTLLTAAGTIGGLAAATTPTKAIEAAAGIMVGMTAIGLGFAGFFTGIAIGDFLSSAFTKAGKAPGATIKVLMDNFFDIFDSAPKVTALMTVLSAGGLIGGIAAKSPAAAVKASGGLIMGMTSIGLGLAGFFTGLAIGDFITSALTPAGKAPGSSIKTLMDNFFGIFDDPAKVTALIAILVAAGSVAALGVAATPAAAVLASAGIIMGMTAIGLGLAGFMVGILAGDLIASLGAIGGFDGSAMNKLLGNLLDAFAGVDVKVL